MKKDKTFFLLLVICFLNFCHNGKDKISLKEIDFKSISIERKSFGDFWSFVKIKKAIKLETKDNSLIGNVDLLHLDKNGNIFVGDYNSSKKILRFDKDGNFITSYGKTGQGPGEYIRIISFAINSDGSVFLLTGNKLIKFDKDNKLIKEVKINYIANDIIIINDLVYISIMRYRHYHKIKKAILILDSNFIKVGEISSYDTRLEKYLFIPNKVFSKSGNNLFFIDNYDLKLQIFNSKLQEMSFIKIPNENATLDVIWEKPRLTEKDRQEIKNRLHRFNFVFGYKDGLFLLEYCKGKKIYDYWILNLEKKKAIIFPYPGQEFFTENLFFDRVAGSYDNGIIGVFNNDEKFNKYKKDFPALKDIEFNIEDNPILAFFEFNKIE